MLLRTVVSAGVGLLVFWVGYLLIGRPPGRPWSPREWERYRRTGNVPARDRGRGR